MRLLIKYKRNCKNIGEKLNPYILIFSSSVFFIFYTMEGSFLVRSILIPLFLLVVYTLFFRKKVRVTNTIKYFAILECVFICSAIKDIIIYDLSLSVVIQILYQLGIFLWYSLLVQEINYTKRDLNLFINCYIFVCVISSIYVLFRNLVLHTYASSFMSLSGHIIGKNFYGAFVCIATVLSAMKALYAKNKKKYFITTVILLIGILFTNSRGTILAVTGSIALLLIQFNYNNGKLSRKRVVIILGIIFLLAVSIRPVLDLIPDWMYNRYFVNSYNDMSNMDRILYWKNALEGILQRPILGFGPGVFANLPQYQVTDFGTTISDATYSHNTYLDVAVNGGIVGLFFFVLIVFHAVWGVFKYNKIFLPIVLALIITSGILGAGKSVYFWNALIFLELVDEYAKKYPGIDILA